MISEDRILFPKSTKGRPREKLVATGIPADQIAIKTANINELKGVDLLSRECEIRYIITVDALKDGWDCPFAYILASLANKTSQVDVEQILGRVLRQPHAARQCNPLLNMSYVLTSSNDFTATLNQIIKGLNSAGFSKRDFRAADQVSLDLDPQPAVLGSDQQPEQTQPKTAPRPKSSSTSTKTMWPKGWNSAKQPTTTPVKHQLAPRVLPPCLSRQPRKGPTTSRKPSRQPSPAMI